jgi:hypothetical protein
LTGGPDDTSTRLTRLEEHSAFTAHESDQLAEHVKALMRALDSLTRRVDALEARARRLDAPSPEAPHPDSPVE